MTPAWNRESRARNLERLRRETFDVLIIGGGINGAGIARDLALRGVKTALVEQGHFASGTSGKNSQLIHGGLRYLKHFEIRLVHESLRERATLLDIAPHLVEAQPFLIPMYGWRARVYYGAGLWVYDLLASSRSIGRSQVLSRGEVAAIEPRLAREGLTHGEIFFDCRIHSARFVLENLWDAARLGAVVANYARAQRQNGQIVVNDLLAGESFPVRAARLVNATGAWGPGEGLRLVRGSHIVIPRVNASGNAMAFFEDSGRIVFVIPWGPRGELSLVGTTDVDHSTGPDNVHISPEEAGYLLRIVHRLFPSAHDAEPVGAFSALRPLVRNETQSATDTSREHRIWTDSDGVVRVVGGKYTTYRAMSEEAADLITSARCVTATTPVGGNTKERIAGMRASVNELAARHSLAPDEVLRIIHDYGMQAPNVLANLPVTAEAGLSRIECAQIAFAVEHEMAQRLENLLLVSTYWGYERRWTAGQLAPFAREMGLRLGWDSSRAEREIAAFLAGR